MTQEVMTEQEGKLSEDAKKIYEGCLEATVRTLKSTIDHLNNFPMLDRILERNSEEKDNYIEQIQDHLKSALGNIAYYQKNCIK